MRPLYQYFDLFEFFALCIAVIASIIVVFHFSHPMDNYVIYILGGIACALGIKAWKLSRQATMRLRHLSSSFHDLTHLIRDEFYILSSDHKSKTLTRDLLIRKLTETATKVVNILAAVLTDSTGYPISVCIKYFDIADPVIADRGLNDLLVKTMCRSANSHPARLKTNSCERAVDNTALAKIVFDNWDCFAQSDLYRYKEKYNEEYVNSDQNWKKYYRSTIVVPIRIKLSVTDPSHEKAGYDLLGFLCADSMSNQAIENNEISDYVNVVKGFADILYQYFDRVLFFYRKLATQTSSEGTEK
jgi:hypothetical protein